MAKIYPYEIFKIKREIQSLEVNLHEMLANRYMSWMDRYQIDQIKKRIIELNVELKAIMTDEQK